MKLLKWFPALVVPWVMMASPAAAQSVTGPPTNLTPGSYSPDTFSSIANNGSRISYTRGKGNFDLSYTYDNLVTMNPDGSGKSQMEILAYFGGSETHGQLTSDGVSIVLRQSGRGGATENGLWKATVDPYKQTQLTQDSAGNDDSFPTWNFAGTKIAFISKRNTGNYQAYVMNPVPEDFGTNSPVQITNWSDGEAAQPRGAADGTLLLIKKSTSGATEIFRVAFQDTNGDGEGDNLTQVTSLGAAISWPSQPVAGGPIYFLKAAKDGRTHVFSVAADGTGLHQVTGGQYTEDYPCASVNKLAVTITDPVLGGGNQDIYVYNLSTDTGNGTVSGVLTSSAGAPQAGATVNAYDGDTLKGTTTTNATGQYTLSLPPGGYTLEYVTTNPASYTVTRSVAISAAGIVTMDAFTTPTAAPRPSGLLATVKAGKAVLRWTKGNDPTGGYTISGYNVYSAASELGPWTKVTATPVAATGPLQYTDSSANLATAFYKVSTVTSNGTATLESAFTDVAQAANNLVFNPSFEQVGDANQPVGWTKGVYPADNDAVMESNTAAAIDGTHALSMVTGVNVPGAVWYTTDPLYCLPVQPGVPAVEGMFVKFKDMATSWPMSLKAALNVPGYTYWYPYENNIGISPWGTPGVTNGGGTTDWLWQANTTNIFPFEFSTSTRLSPLMEGDSAHTPGVSTVYVDEVTYQVKRFGATGLVFGRIVDDQGKGMAGITVKVGNVSIVTDGSDWWKIPNAPTGEQTLTISVPHKADYTVTIPNYGGYRVPGEYVVSNPGPFTIDGNVFLPTGKPAVGADVRLVKTDASDTEVQNWETTTDANGHYSFGSGNDDVTSANVSHIVAHMKGYLSSRLDKNFGSSGWSVNNNLTLLEPDTFVESAKTSAAPTIDGHVNASEWAAAQKQMVVMRYESEHPVPVVQSYVYTMWDNDNIYIAYVGDEPDPANMYYPTDVAIWGAPPYWNGHDMFEFRVDPTNGAGAGLGHEWWQIMNSPSASYNVAWRRQGPSQWGGGLSIPGLVVQSYIDTAGKKWSQELQIPFAGLSTAQGMNVTTPAVGDEWAINLSRARHAPDPTGLHSAIGRNQTDPGNANGTADVTSILRFVNASGTLPKGDLNGDRLVNGFDAVLSMRIAAGLEWLDGRLAQGDVNGDNKADLLDTVKIIRKINGKDNF